MVADLHLLLPVFQSLCSFSCPIGRGPVHHAKYGLFCDRPLHRFLLSNVCGHVGKSVLRLQATGRHDALYALCVHELHET
jgi:hypothetical protein